MQLGATEMTQNQWNNIVLYDKRELLKCFASLDLGGVEQWTWWKVGLWFGGCEFRENFFHVRLRFSVCHLYGWTVLTVVWEFALLLVYITFWFCHIKHRLLVSLLFCVFLRGNTIMFLSFFKDFFVVVNFGAD